jgi:3-methyl-2-oxobutanoate hydroxymethyltransferase
MINALLSAEIPVMGHLGLTPQSVNAMGGFRVQGRDDATAHALVVEAKAVVAAGCFAIVIEGVPASLGTTITESVEVPTIGIGAGADCDGQVLVFHDVLGFNRTGPKFVRRYADLATAATEAVAAYAADVRSGAFPSEAETYR